MDLASENDPVLPEECGHLDAECGEPRLVLVEVDEVLLFDGVAHNSIIAIVDLRRRSGAAIAILLGLRAALFLRHIYFLILIIESSISGAE